MSTASPENMDQLAGEYVLGTLPLGGRLEVERRMQDDAQLRAAVSRWQEKLLPLTALVEPVEPSAQLWQRIENSLQAQGAAAPGAVKTAQPRPQPLNPQEATGWWSNLQLWRGLAGTGFAAAAVLAAVLLTRLGPLPAAGAPTQYVVVLVAPGGNAPSWVVQASATQQLSLIPLGQSPVPAEKALQFWTKADAWTAPVSLGLVKPGETIRLPLDKLPPLEPNQLFELTLEPPGGSPTGRPTGPIQFIGRAVKVI